MKVSAGLFAVLNHGGWLRQAWLGLTPLVFVLVGGGGLHFAAAHTGDPGAGGATPHQIEPGSDGPLELKPIQTRGKRLGITLLSAAVWNAIAWALFLRLYANYKRIGTGLFPLSMAGLFAALGAMFLVGCFYTFLQLFSPEPKVRLSKSSLRLGESATLSWDFPDNARIDELTLSLVAQETITTPNRDRSTTSTQRELEKIVLVQENRLRVGSGSVPFTLPKKITRERRGSGPVQWQVHLWAKGSWNVRLAEEYRLPVR
jgi:hypothetical protein